MKRRKHKYKIEAGELIRIEACRMAADILSSRDESPSPLLWSLAVFFESYITSGANATKGFGPKKPVKLQVVSK